MLFYSVAKELCGVTVARTATWFATISFPLLFAAAAIGHQAIDVFLTMVDRVAVGEGRTARDLAVVAIGRHWRAVRDCHRVFAKPSSFFLAFVVLWILAVHPRRWSWRALGAAAHGRRRGLLSRLRR